MKVALVTGAGGWIGLELVKSLLTEGYTVKALVRKNNKELDNIKKYYNDKLHIILGDMVELDNWKDELYGVDSLFHLAAKVHSKPKTKADEDEFYLINRDCTNKLFDYAIEYNLKKVIFVSTVAVYGNHGENSIDINTHRIPKTPYAISKNQAEMYGLDLYKEKGLPISIVQPVTVYGGKDRGNFKKLYNLANKGVLIRFGNGLNKKSIIYYKDLVKMILNISEDKNTSGKIFICGTENIEYNIILKKIKQNCPNTLKIYLGDRISKVIINILNNLNISILSNLSKNIETLRSNNIYDINDSLKYINRGEITMFESWKCNEEYGKR